MAGLDGDIVEPELLAHVLDGECVSAIGESALGEKLDVVLLAAKRVSVDVGAH